MKTQVAQVCLEAGTLDADDHLPRPDMTLLSISEVLLFQRQLDRLMLLGFGSLQDP